MSTEIKSCDRCLFQRGDGGCPGHQKQICELFKQVPVRKV